MSRQTVRIHIVNQRACALCKHWYDPAHNHIRPSGDPFMKLWEYDRDVKSMCEIKHKEMYSQCMGCSKYEIRNLI